MALLQGTLVKAGPGAAGLTVFVLGVDEVDVGVGDRQVLLGALHGSEAPFGARVTANYGRTASFVLAELVVGEVGGVLTVNDRGALAQSNMSAKLFQLGQTKSEKVVTLGGTS